MDLAAEAKNNGEMSGALKLQCITVATFFSLFYYLAFYFGYCRLH